MYLLRIGIEVKRGKKYTLGTKDRRQTTIGKTSNQYTPVKGANLWESKWVAENLWLLERKRMVLCYYTMSSVRSFRQWVG
jgi:hypothetical protein